MSVGILPKATRTSGANASSSVAYLRNVCGIPSGRAHVDPDVAAVGPAQSRQLLQQRIDADFVLRLVQGCEYADASYPLVLRVGHERPSHRAAKKRDELASPHCRSPVLQAKSIVPIRMGNLEGQCPLWVISGHLQAKSCTMSRPAGELGITFLRTQDGLSALLEFAKMEAR